MNTFVEFDDPRSFVLDSVIARLSSPVEAARGLPNEAFTSDSFFALERSALSPTPGFLQHPPVMYPIAAT